MFIEAKLVFQSYVPNEFTIGMLFLRKIKMIKLKTLIEYYEVFELKDIPQDRESYILTNGYPVKPHIYSITLNPDANADILALPEQIGWWDDEPWDTESEDGVLRDIEVKDFNYILEYYDGSIDIQIDDNMFFEEDIAQPIVYMDKVTLSIPSEKSIDEEYDDDEHEEDWDDMDDDDEWPYDQPKDKTDYDPEDFETE